jgi:hypothetical protein
MLDATSARLSDELLRTNDALQRLEERVACIEQDICEDDQEEPARAGTWTGSEALMEGRTSGGASWLSKLV